MTFRDDELREAAGSTPPTGPAPGPPDHLPGGPIEVAETPGFYAWCRCARSRHVPYCDGTHGGTGIDPMIVQLDAPQRVRWCGCGRTTTAPRCDGRGCDAGERGAQP